MIPLDPEVKAAIDRTMVGLRRKKFNCDPAVPARLSRAASVVGSAQKRHGLVIQLALKRALQCNAGLVVWNEPEFFIQDAADHVCQSPRADSLAQSSLPYLHREGRKVELDIVVLRGGFLSSYEIKRGTAAHDAGKTRQIKRDLICTQLLLKSYGARLGHDVTAAEAHLISYYGKGYIRPPWSIAADQLDDHFGCSVVLPVERATEYFRDQLERFFDDIDGDPEGRQLSLLPAVALL